MCTQELKGVTQTYFTPVLIAKAFTAARMMEATSVSINRWMDKHPVVCSCKEILFCIESEGSSDVCYNVYKDHFTHCIMIVTKGHI